jgi:hypothetical protein
MNERPSLGWSAISKAEFSSTRLEKLWRIVSLLAGIAVISSLFLWLTGAAQQGAARATGPAGLHYDPNAP